MRCLPQASDIASIGKICLDHPTWCFWHRHEGCRFAATPKSNGEFWRLKFEGNVRRDVRDLALLRQSGWRVATVWECALKRSVEDVVGTVEEWLQGDQDVLVVE
jgi:DNA mismatch endonuclease (patch repair protein)